ncbi:MAG TPA: hypothetical protein PLO37_12175 [Candidatus Hydrogenedentes bacterium]|nr:hypothetical protein [Candidatus Hydrogenedentota bacterium]HPG67599.1 hypothetical protein [Candidatus Hydrogenedentota bacterium]
MRDGCESCVYEKVYEVQFKALAGDLAELKERVRRLEATLGRGVILLVANLVGVAMTLLQQLLGG